LIINGGLLDLLEGWLVDGYGFPGRLMRLHGAIFFIAEYFRVRNKILFKIKMAALFNYWGNRVFAEARGGFSWRFVNYFTFGLVGVGLVMRARVLEDDIVEVVHVLCVNIDDAHDKEWYIEIKFGLL
jgi:hypothetical protein